MRLNSVGVIDFRDLNKANWLYLRLGDADTTYDGSDVSDVIGSISYDSQTITANSIVTEYLLNTTQFVGEDVSKVYLAATDSGSEVATADAITEIPLTSYYNYRITITQEIIR